MKGGEYLHRYKAFLIVLAATAVVWFIVAMTETKNYSATYSITYQGYDTSRFAIISATDSIEVSIPSSGFQTIMRNRRLRHFDVKVDIGNKLSLINDSVETISFNINTDNIQESLREQMNLDDEFRIHIVQNRLDVEVAQRRFKTFRPQLKDVNFSFASGYCLDGEPIITPDSIRLYGSKTSLERVKEICTDPASFFEISKSGSFTLSIDTSWRRYPDLYISSSTISVSLPVEACTEKKFRIPVQFVSGEEGLKARLYPEEVDVVVWIPTKNYDEVDKKQFCASVTYQNTQKENTLRVTLNQFPAKARVKSINPPQVQYVIIK